MDNLNSEIESEVRKIDEVECWAPEMAWLFSLMTDKMLLKVRDIIMYRRNGEEYYRNPTCKISCGCMGFLIRCIDDELKWRREHDIQIEY